MIFKSVREWIYTRPEMFIGQNKWDKKALQVLIMLVIRAAVETGTLNKCTVVKVSLMPEDVIIIEDNGRGLPIAKDSRFQNSDVAGLTHLLEWYIPTGELTKEHYEEYGFLGSLARLLSVLSESLHIDTVWKGEVYTVTCSRGDITSPLQKVDNATLKQGSRITFKPDSNVFPSPIFSENSLEIGINELASEFPQVAFEFSAVNNNK